MAGKRGTDLDPAFLHGVERTFERRGARVVEWAGFENRCALTGTVGSNPTLSANFEFCGISQRRVSTGNLDAFLAWLGSVSWDDLLAISAKIVILLKL